MRVPRLPLWVAALIAATLFLRQAPDANAQSTEATETTKAIGGIVTAETSGTIVKADTSDIPSTMAMTDASEVTQTLIYDVTGRIDGTDYLIIHDNTLQWHHPANSAAAVGRQGGGNTATTISAFRDGTTLLNAFEWTPGWPNNPPNEIRFDAYSSMFSGVPAMTGVVTNVDISKVSGRGTVTIEQLPTTANDNTLIVKYVDGFNGAALLDARVTVTMLVSVPEPGSAALLLAAGGMVGLVRRPRCGWRRNG